MSKMIEVSDKKLETAAWMFVVMALVMAIQVVVDGLPMHGVDPSWPDHARFHITLAPASKVDFLALVAALALSFPVKDVG